MVARQPGQREFAIRMEWGLRGAQEVTKDADWAVVVDVLSFTTTVSVALDQGAVVFPYPWRDESAQAFARRHAAALAVGRTKAGHADSAQREPDGAGRLVSLSPVSIRAAPGLDRIVLPSPNGSALAAALAGSGCQILAACLRNRKAVATWVSNQVRDQRRQLVIAVIAAGERWPDGTLRPAVEDLWGAGAVIAAMANLGITGLSPEARAASAAWHMIAPEPDMAMLNCTSGMELVDAGFSTDVTIAAELDGSQCVPVLVGGRFVDARFST